MAFHDQRYYLKQDTGSIVRDQAEQSRLISEMTKNLNPETGLVVWTLILSAILLTGCTGSRITNVESIDSSKETEDQSSPSLQPLGPPTQIPEILQRAEFDLGLVLELNFEWMVHENSISSQPVSLSELLLAAQHHYKNDNPLEGERLAILVSEFSKLASEQHALNTENLLNGKNLYSQ